MNRTYYKYTLMASLVLGLGACASEDFWDSFDRTVDGAIDLTVGVEAYPMQHAMTRGSETFYTMAKGTQVRLKVDGVWERKNPQTVSKTTTCTTDGTILSFADAEQLFWDDYGIGDPDNKTNTDNGLTVLGVAVDGMTNAPEVGGTEWESLKWKVVTTGKDVLNGDIIVSNNLTAYKFAERNAAAAKQMTFVHPLSKITFNIKAGQGFPSTGVGATATKFVNDPRLILTKATTLADTAKTENDYVLASGTVNIKEGLAESDQTVTKVVAGTTSITNDKITIVKQAVVYPGTPLGTADGDVIAVLMADGNVYYITAKEIRTAMKAADDATDYKVKAGYNYMINITVNKTGIRTTATVTDWNKVESEEFYPVINVAAGIGGKNGNATPDGFTEFSFWRSETIDKAYQNEATLSGDLAKGDDWQFSQTLYWHHHNEHYHFRGIYPSDTHVDADTDGTQYVAVQNGAYAADAFPCNFLMGMPEFGDDNYMCQNEDHESVDMRVNGICARTTAINLNFRYMMSQVEVKLTSSESTRDDYVDLSHTKVELVDAGKEGKILLRDRSAVVTKTAEKYELPQIDNVHYHGIIIPQKLKDGSTNKVKFKITVYDDVKNTYDVYFADVAAIKVKANGASTSEETDAWEAGVHYLYNLKITKTEIKATATLTDWKTVEASEDVWF